MKGKLFLLQNRKQIGKMLGKALLYGIIMVTFLHPKDNSDEAVQMALNQHKTFIEKLNLPIWK